MFIDFREIERERERERERNIDVREKHRLVTSHTLPRPGIEPANQGIYPDWEQNFYLFGSENDAPIN